MQAIYNRFSIKFSEEEKKALTTVIYMLDDFYDTMSDEEEEYLNNLGIHLTKISNELEKLYTLKTEEG